MTGRTVHVVTCQMTVNEATGQAVVHMAVTRRTAVGAVTDRADTVKQEWLASWLAVAVVRSQSMRALSGGKIGDWTLQFPFVLCRRDRHLPLALWKTLVQRYIPICRKQHW
eukprot:scaffold103396_cov27-Tisochrysis_lutea.AAC.1